MRFASIGSRDASRLPRSTNRRLNSDSSGFTLLETLTALTILAISMVALFDAHVRGLSAAGTAESYAQARIFAQALLTDTVSDWKGALVNRDGREGRYTWAIEVAPVSEVWAELASKETWRLNHVRVTVAWGQNRRVVLDTLKLGRMP